MLQKNENKGTCFNIQTIVIIWIEKEPRIKILEITKILAIGSYKNIEKYWIEIWIKISMKWKLIKNHKKAWNNSIYIYIYWINDKFCDMQNLKKKIKIVIYLVWIHSKYEMNDDS